MGIRTYEITDDSGRDAGAILWQSTAHMPLPLGPFETVEEADAFTDWCHERGLTHEICTAGEAEKVRERREKEREQLSRNSGSLGGCDG